MGLTVLSCAHWFRFRGRLSLVGIALSLAFGLFFWQKALLVTIPAIGVLLLLAHGSIFRRIRSTLPALAALGVTLLAYVPLYLWVSRQPGENNSGMKTELLVNRSLEESFTVYLTGLLDLGLPTFLGGPWGALPSAQSVFDAPSAATWLPLFAAFVAVCALVVAYRRQGFWILAMTIAYAVVGWGLLLTSSRYDLAGLYAVRDARYAADILPVAALSLGFVICPTREEARTGDSLRRAVAPSLLRLRTHASVGLVCLLAMSSLYANGLTWQTLEPQSPKPWVTNLVADAKAVGTANVWDSYAPNHVLMSVFFPEAAPVSAILAPAGLPLQFNGQADRLLAVDASGHLREADIANGANVLPGPVKDCGYLVQPGRRTTVPIPSKLFFWGWGVQLNTYSQTGGSILIGTDKLTTPAEINPGLAQVQMVVEDSVSSLTLEGKDGSGPICVGTVRIGPISASDRSAVKDR
jgi:hypothetical protein